MTTLRGAESAYRVQPEILWPRGLGSGSPFAPSRTPQSGPSSFTGGPGRTAAARLPQTKEAPHGVLPCGASRYRGCGTDLLSRCCTIIGSGCLTTVVGMETGSSSQIWAPQNRFVARSSCAGTSTRLAMKRLPDRLQRQRCRAIRRSGVTSAFPHRHGDPRWNRRACEELEDPFFRPAGPLGTS